MSLVRYLKQPELREPIFIVAFGGWNDAADAATTAVKYLVDRWKPEKIAEIDAESFYIFTETRPTVKYIDGIQRTIIWPSNHFLAYKAADLPRDVVLFLGNEPQLKWKTFNRVFMEVCKRFHASEVVFLGALLADVPHSISVPFSGTSSDASAMERLREIGVHRSRYEGPTGMIGVLQDACRRAKISASSLWAAAPHYLAATPNIKVTAALLTYVNTYLSLGLDLHDIQSDAVRFEEQITTLVARDPEASAYVRRLEEQVSAEGDEEGDEEEMTDFDEPRASGPLPSADSLIRDVEELLRKQRENGAPSDRDDEEGDE